MDKRYRHELKFVLSRQEAELLKCKLSLLMDVDTNSKNDDNTYFIRSLYFDDIYDSAYYEKIDGLEKREKYRIRMYNFDDSFIRLERKEKDRDLTNKVQTKITREEAEHFINCEFDKVDTKGNKLLEEFLLKYKLHQIKPSVIVDYKRLALTYPIEDIRITFDEDIKSGRYNYDIFDRNINSKNVFENDEVVLEVKFNNYIAKHLVDVINEIPSIRLAVSKFTLCREQKEV